MRRCHVMRPASEQAIAATTTPNRIRISVPKKTIEALYTMISTFWKTTPSLSRRPDMVRDG
jgi:hypothetical protein